MKESGNETKSMDCNPGSDQPRTMILNQPSSRLGIYSINYLSA